MTAASSLFRLARELSHPRVAYGSADPNRSRMVEAVQAVHAVKQRGTATINDIAAELGIDQSGASRLMSQAIAAGLVQRERAESDGRARECGLTPAGEELLENINQWQEELLQRLTADWTEEDRREFEVRVRKVLEGIHQVVPGKA